MLSYTIQCKQLWSIPSPIYVLDILRICNIYSEGRQANTQVSPPDPSTSSHSHGAVAFLTSSPSTLALLSAVAGPLKPSEDPVPNLTLTPPLPTFTVRPSADSRSALAPPTGWSGRGRFALTRSMVSCLFSFSERSCWGRVLITRWYVRNLVKGDKRRKLLPSKRRCLNLWGFGRHGILLLWIRPCGRLRW